MQSLIWSESFSLEIGMSDGIGVFSGSGSGGYARVHVRRCDNDQTLSVAVALDEHPWNDQLRAGAYEDWIPAATNGCRYAFEVAKVAGSTWEIQRIVGTDVDTTTRFVAIAAARAVWKVCGYLETEIDIERLT